MAKTTKKLARNLGKGVNPAVGTGPLAGPDYDKLFKQVSDSPPPLTPIDESVKTEEKKKKMKKSIFDS